MAQSQSRQDKRARARWHVELEVDGGLARVERRKGRAALDVPRTSHFEGHALRQNADGQILRRRDGGLGMRLERPRE